ncbi:MAG: hypothetical protein N3A38_14355 [Planctomycetota bacterium]|nr:hypothetical protein [Planctomycetota bacterium]
MRTRNIWTLAIVSASAFLAVGCQDDEARRNLSDARKEIAELKAKIEAIEKVEADRAKAMEDIRKEVREKIEKGLAEIGEKAAKSSDDIRGMVTTRMDEIGRMVKANGENLDAWRKKDQEFLNSEFAQKIAALQEEIKKQGEELKAYMDNQLKDVYPYAYKPRRND